MEVSDIVRLFTEQYKLEKPEIRHDELYCLCPFHDDTRVGNFSINLTNGLYFCFACLSKGNILEYGFRQGLSYQSVINLWQKVKKTEHVKIEIPTPPLDRFLVSSFKNNGLSKYALTRMSAEVLREYNVYCDRFDNPIFFIKDFVGNYRGVWVRDKEYGYILIEPLSVKRDGYLFGQHIPGEYTVLTEGFFDAMAIREKLGQRGVCINGLYLTKKQIKTLTNLQPIYLFTDGDRRGKMARNKIYQQIAHLDVRICGGYFGDADEKSADELNEIIKTAKDKIDWQIYERKHNA